MERKNCIVCLSVAIVSSTLFLGCGSSTSVQDTTSNVSVTVSNDSTGVRASVGVASVFEDALLSDTVIVVEPEDAPEVEAAYEEPSYEESELITLYVEADSLNGRSAPNVNADIVTSFHYGDELQCYDNLEDWLTVKLSDGSFVYIYSEYVSPDKPEGLTVLTETLGVVDGPSGRETFYNLKMHGCIARMQSLGYDYEYWVRGDGVKMFGDYVMVAANFNIRPLGTLVETSLGTGIVVDTGDFVEKYPYGLDIAVTW